MRSLRNHHDWEEGHEDVEAPELNTKNWAQTIESIQEYLRGCLGSTGIPLAYVICNDPEIPAADPPGGYATKVDELIARAPIYGPPPAGGGPPPFLPQYLADRTAVWNKIAAMTRDDDC